MSEARTLHCHFRWRAAWRPGRSASRQIFHTTVTTTEGDERTKRSAQTWLACHDGHRARWSTLAIDVPPCLREIRCLLGNTGQNSWEQLRREPAQALDPVSDSLVVCTLSLSTPARHVIPRGTGNSNVTLQSVLMDRVKAVTIMVKFSIRTHAQ